MSITPTEINVIRNASLRLAVIIPLLAIHDMKLETQMQLIIIFTAKVVVAIQLMSTRPDFAKALVQLKKYSGSYKVDEDWLPLAQTVESTISDESNHYNTGCKKLAEAVVRDKEKENKNPNSICLRIVDKGQLSKASNNKSTISAITQLSGCVHAVGRGVKKQKINRRKYSGLGSKLKLAINTTSSTVDCAHVIGDTCCATSRRRVLLDNGLVIPVPISASEAVSKISLRKEKTA